MSTKAQATRRQASRQAVGWPGRCRFGRGRWLECQVIDISSGGAALWVRHAAPEMGAVSVEVQPGGQPSGVLRGTIRHTRPADAGAVVVGIEFAALTKAESSYLARLLAEDPTQ